MLNEPVIGVILTNRIWTDGNIWGCEFLTGDYLDFTRHAHLSYIPLIGEKEQSKSLACFPGLPYKVFWGKGRAKSCPQILGNNGEISSAARILSSGINCPLASSTGRLFDAVSASWVYAGKPHMKASRPLSLGSWPRCDGRRLWFHAGKCFKKAIGTLSPVYFPGIAPGYG